MPQYEVTLPVIGYVTLSIEANNAEAAVSDAYELVANEGVDGPHDLIAFNPDDAEDIANVERASATENDPESDKDTQLAESR